jgi:glyoxylase-like metal-dependent hydrolase (beta-lactamase superfamily II)
VTGDNEPRSAASIDVTRLGDDLYMIDAHMEGYRHRLSCYLYDTPEPVLIDAGPSNSFDHLVTVLGQIGIDDLATVIITHVHIDHGGGAGHFARHFPNARIAVHHLGARHLVTPNRLWNSAARIYGEAELLAKWGPMKPVPEDRIEVLREGDTVSTGTATPLRILDTPGHAKHHVTIFDPDDGAMFVGDTAGLCYPHGHMIQPNTPPPDFDPHVLTGQLRRMAALDPAFVGFAHFGPRHDAQTALSSAEARVWEWIRMIESYAGLETDEAGRRLALDTIAQFQAFGSMPEHVAAYGDRNARWDMHITGVRRWMSQAEQR